MIAKLLLAVSLPALLLAHEYGPDPGYDGAPKQPPGVGVHPNACASGGCHSNDQNPSGAGGPINAFVAGAVVAGFSNGSSYTPGGAPITITVSVVDPVNTHYGFEMSARPESDLANTSAGDFTPGKNQIVVCADGSVKFKKCPAGNTMQYIEHSYPMGFSVGTTPYTFTWTPPATNIGKIHFYVAGNAANNDLKADGNDHIYTAEYILTPALCSGKTPVIGKVISAGGFGASPSFASGSWIEIYGSDFASDTWQWQGMDFNGTAAPTTLAGINVSVNGNAAFMYFVSPGQVDVQAPADSKTGTVDVQLMSCSDASAAIKGQKDALAPGFLAPPGFLKNGKQYLVAQFQDGTYVGDPKVVAGTTRPAKPGELLTIYGIGFGDVTTASGGAVVPGVVVTDTNSLVNPLQFSFGSTVAKVQYSGLAPGNIGLYQFNVTVPNVVDGDAQISVRLNGNAVPQALFLSIKQ
ncbi:MAG TPA: choice-of-anchor V domain-containing protein [Bryobacteraceae bacterium]|jgi:uncharacterized protein (TIGR03437 family)